jgi:hypothetical protein
LTSSNTQQELDAYSGTSLVKDSPFPLGPPKGSRHSPTERCRVLGEGCSLFEVPLCPPTVISPLNIVLYYSTLSNSFSLSLTLSFSHSLTLSLSRSLAPSVSYPLTPSDAAISGYRGSGSETAYSGVRVYQIRSSTPRNFTRKTLAIDDHDDVSRRRGPLRGSLPKRS